MRTGSSDESTPITASEGGFAAVNVNSPHGVAQSSGRDSRIVGRVNALLSTASSAFSLTRNLLPPGN